jgi:hypothetical protein
VCRVGQHRVQLCLGLVRISRSSGVGRCGADSGLALGPKRNDFIEGWMNGCVGIT